MVGSAIFLKRNIIILFFAITVSALLLSILSYQYYSLTANKTTDIAVNEIRTNLRIEAYDLSQILQNKLDIVSALVKSVADSPVIKNNDYKKAQMIFDSRQNYTTKLTDFYMWIDKYGKVISVSNVKSQGVINDNGGSSNPSPSIIRKNNELGLNYRPYFTIPKQTHKVYYSSIIESKDKVSRLYISWPILLTTGSSISNNNSITGTNGFIEKDNNTKRIIFAQQNNNNNGTAKVSNTTVIFNDAHKNNSNRNTISTVFEGVIVAAIRLDALGNFLENQLLLSQLNGTLGVMDKNGVILYDSSNQSYVGKYVFGNEFQSILSSVTSSSPQDSRVLINKILKDSLHGNSGLNDVSFGGQKVTMAYNPVNLNGKNFLVLYLMAPHNLANNVLSLIFQEKNFSLLVVIIIAVVAAIVAFIVLTWNKRLERIVSTRTGELSLQKEKLKNTIESLEKSNKKLEAANERLKSQDIMQKEFINIASHEMKTPTQAILGYSVLISNYPQKKDEFIQVIRRNAIRLQQLTNDILDVTRIESQTLRLNKDQFNLVELVSNVVDDYNTHLVDNDKDIKITDNGSVSDKGNNNNRTFGNNVIISDDHNNIRLLLNSNKQSLFIEADKGRISQVVSNLISNAIKFTREGGGGDIIVKLVQKSESHKVIVSVKDSGPGISSNIFPRLFSKFASESFEGTGLGLFISKSIIEAHGGKVWAYNNDTSNDDSEDIDGANKSNNNKIVEKGATFAFSLPLKIQ